MWFDCTFISNCWIALCDMSSQICFRVESLFVRKHFSVSQASDTENLAVNLLGVIHELCVGIKRILQTDWTTSSRQIAQFLYVTHLVVEINTEVRIVRHSSEIELSKRSYRIYRHNDCFQCFLTHDTFNIFKTFSRFNCACWTSHPVIALMDEG